MKERSKIPKARKNGIRLINTQWKVKAQLKNLMVILTTGVSKNLHGPFLTPKRSVIRNTTRRIRCIINIVTSYQSVFLTQL